MAGRWSRSPRLRRTPRALAVGPSERLALLSVTEALDNTGTTFREHASDEDPPYRGMWASVPGRSERAVLEGHTGGVNGVCAVRVQGRELLASAADDRTMQIWDPATGATMAEIPTSAVALAITSFDAAALFVGLESGVLAVQASGRRRRDRNQ